MNSTRRIPVFFSFHYDLDVFRVQMVKQMGALDGEEPVSPGAWEQVWKRGDTAIRDWIDENMKHRRCIVVLVGTETYNRPWVQYEIRKGWNDGKGVVGVHIHSLKDARTQTTSRKGINPFDQFTVGNNAEKLSKYVRCYDPNALYAYDEIKGNLASWVERAIADRQ
jgi:hypothetical protein